MNQDDLTRINKQYMKNIVFLIFILLSNLHINCQENTIAYPGVNGIFIHTGMEIPNGQSIEFYIIDRRDDIGKWETIAKLKFPETQKQFSEDYQKTNILFPYIMEKVDLESIYKVLSEVSTWADSSAYYITGKSIAVMLAARNMFYDSDVQQHVYYQYRVTQFDISGKLVTQTVSNKVKFPGFTDMNNIQVNNIIHDEKGVNIRWIAQRSESPYTATLYHFKDGQPELDTTRVNFYKTEDKIVYLAKISNFSDQQYFIIPFDMYGNQGEPSGIAYVEKIQPEINYFTNLKAVPNKNQMQVDLSWKIINYDDLKYIDILRSEDFRGEFKQISTVASNVSSYSDMNVDPDKIYYYRLRAQLTFSDQEVTTTRFFGYGHQKQSPIPPEIKGVDSDEKSITLEINSNEQFLTGIRVYRKRADIDGDPSTITDLIPLVNETTQFVDTSSLEGGHYYQYFAKSENNSGLESEFSRPVRIQSQQRVELLPITGFTNFVYLESEVNLYWDHVMENQSQMLGYSLYRKKDIGAWEPIIQPDSLFSLNRYIDQNIERGSRYEYKICPVDFMLREGVCSYTQAYVNPESKRVGPGVVLWDIEEGIFIQFSKVIDDKLDKFRIYRYQRGQNVKMIKELPLVSNEYLDKSAKKGLLYFYYITTVSVDGIESMPGEESGIRR